MVLWKPSETLCKLERRIRTPVSGKIHLLSPNMQKAVVIIGPPWPRSGTARVIQNQIEFYRERGYYTVFVCVPIHSSYTETYSDWDDIKAGMQELGADQIFFAPIDHRRFIAGKYLGWIKNAFRGTALDWIVLTGSSARLPREAIRLIDDLPISLLNVNHVFTLGFAQRLLRDVIRPRHRVPLILETHDVSLIFWRSGARSTRGPSDSIARSGCSNRSSHFLNRRTFSFTAQSTISIFFDPGCRRCRISWLCRASTRLSSPRWKDLVPHVIRLTCCLWVRAQIQTVRP